MDNDLALIHHYAETRDAEAFAAIVKRYQNLVFGVCLRIHGRRDRAEDSAQECFLKLARKAGSVRSSLAGWLHRCATNTSLRAASSETARTKRERAYADMTNGDNDGVAWERVSPELDRGLDALPDALRHVLVEHFLRQRTQAEIAVELGLSRPTLSRRVSDGVDRLRTHLKQAGVTVPAALLTTLLAEQTASAAPAALAATLGKMALAGVGQGGAAATTATTATATATAVLGSVQAKVAAVAVVAVLAAAGYVGHQKLKGLAPKLAQAAPAPKPAAPRPKPAEPKPKAPNRLDLSGLTLEGDHWGQDSFSLTMQVVARLLGKDVAYETVFALSTNGFAPAVAPGEPCRASWRMFGREQCIDLVAGYIGLNVRKIEFPTPPALPPRDAKGRQWGTPAANRWLAERKKVCAGIIARELDSGAAVICDGGWKHHFYLWGIVTDATPDGEIVGTTIDGPRVDPMDHIRSYWAVTPGTRTYSHAAADREMLRRAAARIEGGEPFKAEGVLFGLAAMDRWIVQMQKPAFQEDDPASSAGNAQKNALITHNGAKSVAAYLRTRAGSLQARTASMLLFTAMQYDRVAAALEPFVAWDPEAKDVGYQAIMGNAARQSAHAEEVLKPVRKYIATTAAVMKHAAAIKPPISEAEEWALEAFYRIYRLEPGEDFKRIASPFLPGRLVYYRTTNPGQAKLVPRGPEVMHFRWNGKLRRWGSSFGRIRLRHILRGVAGLYPYEIEGDERLIEREMSSDFIIREGASQDAIIDGLRESLAGQPGMPVSLTFREVERPVIVARGRFELRLLPNRRAIELYEESLTDQTRGGGGSGNFGEFLKWVGMYINMHVIDEAKVRPTKNLDWHHNRKPKGRSMDHMLVLDNLSMQTGLEFTQETRRVRVLVVERVERGE